MTSRPIGWRHWCVSRWSHSIASRHLSTVLLLISKLRSDIAREKISRHSVTIATVGSLEAEGATPCMENRCFRNNFDRFWREDNFKSKAMWEKLVNVNKKWQMHWVARIPTIMRHFSTVLDVFSIKTRLLAKTIIHVSKWRHLRSLLRLREI